MCSLSLGLWTLTSTTKFSFLLRLARKAYSSMKSDSNLEFGIFDIFLLYSNLLIYLAMQCLAAFNTLILVRILQFKIDETNEFTGLNLNSNWKSIEKCDLKSNYTIHLPEIPSVQMKSSKFKCLFMFSHIKPILIVWINHTNSERKTTVRLPFRHRMEWWHVSFF